MTDPATKALFQAMLESIRDGAGPLYEALDLLAGETGENRFRYASSILRGSSVGGRGRIDDRAKMAMVRTLEQQGLKRSSAINLVAQRHATPETCAASVARRLRDRFRKEKLEKTVPPISGADIVIQ